MSQFALDTPDIVDLLGSDVAQLSFHLLFGKKLVEFSRAGKTEVVISVSGMKVVFIQLLLVSMFKLPLVLTSG